MHVDERLFHAEEDETIVYRHRGNNDERLASWHSAGKGLVHDCGVVSRAELYMEQDRI